MLRNIFSPDTINSVSNYSFNSSYSIPSNITLQTQQINDETVYGGTLGGIELDLEESDEEKQLTQQTQSPKLCFSDSDDENDETLSLEKIEQLKYLYTNNKLLLIYQGKNNALYDDLMFVYDDFKSELNLKICTWHFENENNLQIMVDFLEKYVNKVKRN